MIQVMKRNGQVIPWNDDKIGNAIRKAMMETKKGIDEEIIKEIVGKIETEVFLHYEDKSVMIEDIQDMVEEALMKVRPDVARRYIVYREERTKLRNKPWGDMTEIQKNVFHNKYRHDNETLIEFIERIANGNGDIKKSIMHKRMIFGGRILAGRGIKGQNISFSNCYHLKIQEDNLSAIFDTFRDASIICSRGGGIGISFEELRPNGSLVNNAAKTSTGSVSYMKMADAILSGINQDGRRGAAIFTLPVTHPDIDEFLTAKNEDKVMPNANISVVVNDDFMQQIYELLREKPVIYEQQVTRKSPDTTPSQIWHTSFATKHEVFQKDYNILRLFEKMIENAWDYGEPGILYWDRVKDWHLMSEDPNYILTGCNP